jgi:hypothetical protein
LAHSQQFFFDRHALTLVALTPFGKSPADLGSYDVPASLLMKLNHQQCARPEGKSILSHRSPKLRHCWQSLNDVRFLLPPR